MYKIVSYLTVELQKGKVRRAQDGWGGEGNKKERRLFKK